MLLILKLPTIKKAVKLLNSIGVLKLTAINLKKTKIMKKMLFGLIATVMMSVSGNANNLSDEFFVKKEITNYVLDGKSYSPIEYGKLDSTKLEDIKECTITVRITVDTPLGPQTLTTTETFEASWWGCALAKAGAFIAGLWNPSI